MKKILRKKYLQRRNNLNKKLIDKKSLIIFNKLKRLREFKIAKTIMLYVSFGSEVNTQLMLKKLLDKKINKNFKKIICVPVVKGNRLFQSVISKFNDLNKKNKYGILEPSKIKKINKNKIDLIIAPGIVFDKKGYRIGYGKGYFDKLLKGYKGVKVGLAFKIQIIKKIPNDKHDIPLNIIIQG